jgi:16S rRNA (cytidine1402-2'-O)-methyltransferase
LGQDNPSLVPQPGHLYVVATPIGNLGDLSERARSLLSRVDLIACEDTRTSGIFLHRLGIERPLVAYHEHNEREVAERLAKEIGEGKSIALITDAGTPALSDPGFRLVRACRRLALPVVPVPGPNAAVTALSASGLPTHGFLFAGFLAPKTSARRAFFEKHRADEYTIILYESCHRIAGAVADARAVLGDQRVLCLAKEISKVHETFITGPAAQVEERLAKLSLRGEFVLLVAPDGYEL